MHATPHEAGGEVTAAPVQLALPLRLAPGTELLGRYESSAFSQPQYLIRRGDGQILQVGQLAYAVAMVLDGARDGVGIASAMSSSIGRPVSIDNVTYLVERKLAPLGILATEGAPAALTRVNPLLALRFRARVIPERLHRGATWFLRPLFRAPVVAAVLLGVAAVNAWVFISNRGALVRGTRDLVLHPALLLLVIGLTIAAGAFHELGHATAARYGGAKPGVMGVGIYLMMPAFYTDVSDSYRLDRRGRLRTDLGGVYFNAITIVIAAGVFAATGSRALLVFIVLSEIEVLYQFLPFVQMDGYYVVADLIGVPNLFAFVRPVIASAFRRHDPSRQRLQALTKRTRVAIRTWVSLTVPILAFDVFLFVLLAPKFFPGMWHSAQLFEKSAAYNVGRGNVIAGLDNVVQLVFLAIPAVGLALMVGMVGGRILRRVGSPVLRPVREHPRWIFATLAVAAALLIAFIIPGGRVGEPEVPTQAAQGARPTFQAPAPLMAIGDGHGRPAHDFEVVVGVRPTGDGAAAGTPPGTAAGAAPSPTAAGRAVVRAGQAPPAVGVEVTTPVGNVGAAVSAVPPPVSATPSAPVATAGASLSIAPVATAGASLSVAPVATAGASLSVAPASVSAQVSTPVASLGASVSAASSSVASTSSVPLIGPSGSAPGHPVSVQASASPAVAPAPVVVQANAAVAPAGASPTQIAPTASATISTPLAPAGTSVKLNAPLTPATAPIPPPVPAVTAVASATTSPSVPAVTVAPPSLTGGAGDAGVLDALAG